MVGRGDADDVDVLVRDDLADILLERGSLALFFLDLLHRPADDGLVGVADGGDDSVLFFVEKTANVIHATAVDSDHGHTEFLGR